MHLITKGVGKKRGWKEGIFGVSKEKDLFSPDFIFPHRFFFGGGGGLNEKWITKNTSVKGFAKKDK